MNYYALCLGNDLKDFTNTNVKKTSIKEVVFSCWF